MMICILLVEKRSTVSLIYLVIYYGSVSVLLFTVRHFRFLPQSLESYVQGSVGGPGFVEGQIGMFSVLTLRHNAIYRCVGLHSDLFLDA